MAITTGTSVSLMSAPTIAGQNGAIIPVLQAQDGSFVGTAQVGDPENPTPYMVAFDQSGGVRWSVPNEQPQIATDDGGVIGQSGITYDQNGNATGQTTGSTVYSWLGNAYQVGSVDQVVGNWYRAARTWTSVTWAKLTARKAPYTELQSCTDPTLRPPMTCPGPKEAIFTAWYWLKTRLNDGTRAFQLDNNVFYDSTGNLRKDFIAYLGLGSGPQFYDGESSPVSLRDAACDTTSGTVDHQFALSNNSNTCEMAALTCRQDPAKPLRAFFEPRAISFDNQGATDGNVAILFHEALHGFLKKDDPQLQSFLGCTSGFPDTRDITIYLQQFVGAQQLQGLPASCKYIEAHSIPANPNVCVR